MMRLVVRACWAFVLAGLGTWAMAFSSRASAKPSGATLYKQNCSICHRLDGKGFKALRTPDLTDPKWQAATPDKAILSIVKQGKKGTSMPAFSHKLKSEEIQAAIEHIRTLNSQKTEKKP